LVESKIGEKSLNFGRAHCARMPFLVKEDKTLDPVGVSFLRPDGLVFDPQHFADLVEQPGLGIGNDPGAGDVVRAKPFGLGEVVKVLLCNLHVYC
jgi:hypothetical protein